MVESIRRRFKPGHVVIALVILNEIRGLAVVAAVVGGAGWLL
jgi:hypothetical protein